MLDSPSPFHCGRFAPQLARLDSRLLADAGISEAQRYEELSKPFWR